MGEFLPGYEASNWYGLCAPKATPAELGIFIVEETEKWAKVIKSAGIKPE